MTKTELFLKYTHKCRYYNLFVVALETGMRIGELKGLYWSDMDYRIKHRSKTRTFDVSQKELRTMLLSLYPKSQYPEYYI